MVLTDRQIKDDPTSKATMRTMNMTMPLFSLVMVFTLPTGIGIYWIVSAIVRMVQQVFINKHLSKISVDDMIEKNKEKAQKKKENVAKKQRKSTLWLRQIQKSIKSSATQSSSMSDKEREEKLEKQEQMRNREVLLQKPTWLRILMRISKGHIFMDYITVTAKNLDDAITEALVQLEVTSDRLDYEVIEKGSDGFLGFGRKQAVIKARRKEEPVVEVKAEKKEEKPVKGRKAKS